jgi:hypothetical protein
VTNRGRRHRRLPGHSVHSHGRLETDEAAQLTGSQLDLLRQYGQSDAGSGGRQPDTILGREDLFGINPETDLDRLVRRPQAYDAEGEIVGDPGQINPWGTGPGFGYGVGVEGLNWRNI